VGAGNLLGGGGGRGKKLSFLRIFGEKRKGGATSCAGVSREKRKEGTEQVKFFLKPAGEKKKKSSLGVKNAGLRIALGCHGKEAKRGKGVAEGGPWGGGGMRAGKKKGKKKI